MRDFYAYVLHLFSESQTFTQIFSLLSQLPAGLGPTWSQFINMVFRSRSSGTVKTYQPYISRWFNWSSQAHIDPVRPTAAQVAISLSYLYGSATSSASI